MASIKATSQATVKATNSSSDLLVLADSNVQDPKPSTLFECVGREFHLHRVNTMASLESLSVEPDTLKYMVVACLSPIIAESSGIQDVDDKELALGEASEDVLRFVSKWLELHPRMHVMFVPPLFRSIPATFKDDINVFMASVMVFCATQPRVQLLRGFQVTRTNLQRDGSTLVQASMIRYAESIFSVVRSIIESRVPSPEKPTKNWDETLDGSGTLGQDVSTIPTTSTPFQRFNRVVVDVSDLHVAKPNYGASVSSRQLVDPETVTLHGLATAMNGFFVTFLERCIRENEEFASGQESDCYRDNCQMNDKIIVNGYQGVAYPTPQSERNNVFRPLVAATVKQVLGRDEEFSVHGRNGEVRNQTLPPVEIRFAGGAEVADTFRREGSRMSRDKKPGVAHLYFNACTTLATRVRIEVLKAIGLRLTNSQRNAYCVATHSKPYLSVGPQQGMQGRRQSYKYVEAVKAFGRVLDDTFLDRAYERAGMNFTGRLEMIFLVLHEEGAIKFQEKRDQERNSTPRNNNTVPYVVGAKRRLPGLSDDPPSKK